jgi:hypothetical protein
VLFNLRNTQAYKGAVSNFKYLEISGDKLMGKCIKIKLKRTELQQQTLLAVIEVEITRLFNGWK